ncbi:hypothetical protein D9M73_113450 [compost metagenome]
MDQGLGLVVSLFVNIVRNEMPLPHVERGGVGVDIGERPLNQALGLGQVAAQPSRPSRKHQKMVS